MPLTTYSLNDDPDRLLTTEEELLRTQGQMEELVNEMVKYRIGFADLHRLQNTHVTHHVSRALHLPNAHGRRPF